MGTSRHQLDLATNGRGNGEPLLGDTVVLALSERTAVLVLLGEHDLVTSRALRAQLMSLVEENTAVIVDVSQARFIGSTLLHTLIDANKAAGAAGGRVVLQTGYDRHVHRLVKIVGLAAYLDCVTTREKRFHCASTERDRWRRAPIDGWNHVGVSERSERGTVRR